MFSDKFLILHIYKFRDFSFNLKYGSSENMSNWYFFDEILLIDIYIHIRKFEKSKMKKCIHCTLYTFSSAYVDSIVGFVGLSVCATQLFSSVSQDTLYKNSYVYQYINLAEVEQIWHLYTLYVLNRPIKQAISQNPF